MCALHELRAQTHLGLSAVRCSDWFPPGDPPTPVLVGTLLVGTRNDGIDDAVVESVNVAPSTPSTARCDCLAGVLHAL